MKIYGRLCIICDCRFGDGTGEVRIDMCQPCRAKYREKVQSEQMVKYECRAEREAVYLAYKRLETRA